jgi:hypothetical protein
VDISKLLPVPDQNLSSVPLITESKERMRMSFPSPANNFGALLQIKHLNMLLSLCGVINNQLPPAGT